MHLGLGARKNVMMNRWIEVDDTDTHTRTKLRWRKITFSSFRVMRKSPSFTLQDKLSFFYLCPGRSGFAVISDAFPHPGGKRAGRLFNTGSGTGQGFGGVVLGRRGVGAGTRPTLCEFSLRPFWIFRRNNASGRWPVF